MTETVNTLRKRSLLFIVASSLQVNYFFKNSVTLNNNYTGMQNSRWEPRRSDRAQVERFSFLDPLSTLEKHSDCIILKIFFEILLGLILNGILASLF